MKRANRATTHADTDHQRPRGTSNPAATTAMKPTPITKRGHQDACVTANVTNASPTSRAIDRQPPSGARPRTARTPAAPRPSPMNANQEIPNPPNRASNRAHSEEVSPPSQPNLAPNTRTGDSTYWNSVAWRTPLPTRRSGLVEV